MKTIIKLVLVLIMITSTVNAQKYITKNGKIRFKSTTTMEKIEAKNNQVKAALDASTGEIVFQVLITSFEFKQALMQEHFNENYMESTKFPNAQFKGKITNIKEINFKVNGRYKVNVEGELTIHGVTKKVSQMGFVEILNGKVAIFSEFWIAVKEYNIAIPSTVVKNIAENVEVTVEATLEPKK